MKFDKSLKEEYFLVCKPSQVKYFGLMPALTILTFLIIFYPINIALNVIYYTFMTAFILSIFVFLLNFVDLLTNDRRPEIDENTDFILNETKTAYILSKKNVKNIVKYEFDTFAKTTWFTYNIVLNFILNVLCRFCHLFQYYLKTKIYLINPKKIHPKAIYYHLINTSLSHYVKSYDPEIVFDDITIMSDNRKQWQCKKKTIYKTILTVDHDDCTTKKLDIYETEQNYIQKKPKTITDQYEIYSFVMFYIKFISHTSVHVSAPWIGDIDEEYLPLKEHAEQAVNGVNNLVLKWEPLFIGTVWYDITDKGIHQGMPVYQENNQMLAERSQYYNVVKAIESDPDINYMIETSINRKNRKRIAQGLPSYTEKEIQQKQQNLRFGICTSMAEHCMDHYCHDRFLSPLINSEYLQFSDVMGTIFGTRWTDDILSNLKSNKQPLARAVYKIIEREAPDLKEGFHWTIFQ